MVLQTRLIKDGDKDDFMLQRILKIFGTPDFEDWYIFFHYFKNTIKSIFVILRLRPTNLVPGYLMRRLMWQYPSGDMKKLLQHTDETSKHVIVKLLQLNPEKRPSATEAIQLFSQC